MNLQLEQLFSQRNNHCKNGSYWGNGKTLWKEMTHIFIWTHKMQLYSLPLYQGEGWYSISNPGQIQPKLSAWLGTTRVKNIFFSNVNELTPLHKAYRLHPILKVRPEQVFWITLQTLKTLSSLTDHCCTLLSNICVCMTPWSTSKNPALFPLVLFTDWRTVRINFLVKVLPTAWPFIYIMETVLNSINDSEIYRLFHSMNNLKMWFVNITRGCSDCEHV